MECKRVVFSGHAIRRLHERGIPIDAVMETLRGGDLIFEYPDDTPYPSLLLLGYVKERPLHVAVAFDSNSGTCIVLTSYEPDPVRWNDDFRIRRNV